MYRNPTQTTVMNVGQVSLSFFAKHQLLIRNKKSPKVGSLYNSGIHLYYKILISSS
jgi:hypothetical protein